MTPISHLLAVFSIIVATLPVYILLVEAQPDTPWKIAVHSMAYASTGTHLFIQGGSASGGALSTEYFQLDLSVNWTTDNPTWASLKLGTANPPIAGTTGVVLPDGGFLLKGPYPTGIGQLAGVISKQNTWTPLPESLLKLLAPSSAGSTLVVSPKGEVYFLRDGFMMSSISSANPVSLPLSGNIIASVWSPGLQEVLSVSLGPSGLVFQTMGASSWTPLAIQGSISALDGICLTRDTVDDNKLYIFGGGSALGASSGQLYILDVKSRTVAKLGPETEKRAYLACAATQYSFFAWGGLDTSGAPTKTLAPLVFNFASGTWVNSNIIPPPPPPPLPPQVSGTNPNSGNSGNGTGTKPGTGNGNDDGSESGGSQLNIAAIAGGIAGGIAVITLVVIGVYFWHKRRKEQKHDDSSDTPKKLSSKEDHFGGRNRQGSRPSDNESDYDGRRPESLISGYSDEESQFTPVRRKASFPMDKPARYRRMQTPIPGTEPRSLNRGDHNIHNQYDSRVDSMVAEANSNTFDSYDNRSTRNQGHRPSNPEGNRGPQSPHEIQQDRQPNGRRPKTPRPTPTESTSSQNGDTRPTDLQYTTRPRGPQYIAPRPNDPHYWEPDPSDPQYIGPRLNDPQFGVPRPLDLNYGVQTYRDPQFSYENRNNPHSTPRIMAYSSRHNSTFEGAPQHKHSTPTTLKPPPAIPTLDE